MLLVYLIIYFRTYIVIWTKYNINVCVLRFAKTTLVAVFIVCVFYNVLGIFIFEKPFRLIYSTTITVRWLIRYNYVIIILSITTLLSTLAPKVLLFHVRDATERTALAWPKYHIIDVCYLVSRRVDYIWCVYTNNG